MPENPDTDADGGPVAPEPPADPRARAGLAWTGALALLWVGVPFFTGGAVLWTLEPLGDFLRERPGVGWLIYVAAYAVGSGFGIVPTYAMSVLGGWVFGPVAGVAGAVAGFSGGASVGYAISRAVSRASLLALIDRNPKARALYDDLVRSGAGRSALLVGVIRLPPQCPFALTNLAMGAAAVPFRPFLLGTLAGMSPRTSVGVLFAAAAAGTGAKGLQDFLAAGPGWPVLAGGLAAMIVALAVLAWLGKSALDRVRRSGRLPAADGGRRADGTG